MLIGYARVSTSEQKLDLQLDALREVGVDERHIYTDKISGKLVSADRPGLDTCLRALRQGDTLVVWRIDRLGRNMKDLVDIVYGLGDRGVKVRFLEGLLATTIDVTDSMGVLLFGVFAAMAEAQRIWISENTKAGLAAARARGRVGGRKPKMTAAKVRMIQNAMQSQDTSVRDLCDLLGVTRQTLYRYVSPSGELRGDGKRLLGVTE